MQRDPKIAGAIQTSGEVTIWLDSALDDALVAEGQAREFVNRVQKLRKDSGLEVTDRIRLKYYTSEQKLGAAIATHRAYIASEVLAEDLLAVSDTAQWSTEQEIDGIPVKLHLEKT